MPVILTTQSILQIITALAAIAAAFVAARLTEQYRDKTVKKSLHYSQIKSKVLQPILVQIDDYYQPILEFKRVNLTWDNLKKTRFAVGMNDEPTTFELVSCVAPLNGDRFQPQFPNQNEIDKTTIEQELYEDSRRKHFGTVLQNWESLKSKADGFNLDCLHFSDEIRTSIANKLHLPIDTWNKFDGEYVTPYCGVAIFNRMAGTNSNRFTANVQTSGQRKYLKVSLDNVIMQLDPSADIQNITSLIDEEINDRRIRFLQLKATAEDINKEFTLLKYELTILLEKQELIGKCAYI